MERLMKNSVNAGGAGGLVEITLISVCVCGMIHIFLTVQCAHIGRTGIFSDLKRLPSVGH
jgi:hypothetical protein